MYDLLIKNGLIMDGSGSEPYIGDVAVKDGKIAGTAPSIQGEAAKVIDAAGFAVAPGFIDIHCHSDAAPFFDYRPDSRIAQGVTTELCGNCGISILPATPETREEISHYFFANLQFPTDAGKLSGVYDLDDYIAAADQLKPGINNGILIGHGTLRGAVMGFVNRDPNEEEQKKLEDLLDKLMDQGAFGMSLGLIYPPSAFAGSEEIEKLARVVKKHDGILTVHVRNEGPRVFESVDEMLGIAERSGVHLEISHLKIMTKSLWNRTQELLDKIDAARARGVNVTCDQYPFFVSSTSLTACVPKWAHDGGMTALWNRVKEPSDKLKADIAAEMESRGGADRIVIADCHGFRDDWEGKNVETIAAELGMDPVDAICHILDVCEAAVNCNYYSQFEADRDRILSRRDICVCSDGYNCSLDKQYTPGMPHPRSFSSFVHALQLAREEELMPMAAMVRKMTGLPADVTGMKDRGYLAEGKAADITIFDPKTVAMGGDFMNPVSRPIGIHKVLVAGEVAYENGALTDVRLGHTLRHGAC